MEITHQVDVRELGASHRWRGNKNLNSYITLKRFNPGWGNACGSADWAQILD